jgi:dihydroorotate dehydrogenase (NAD+) catalytic subunit
MTSDLSISFAGVSFKNPVLTASGTFGYGYELADLVPLDRLGGIVTKTVTLNPCQGNLQPRIAEVASGMLNAIGLQNIGVRAFVKECFKKLSRIGVPIIVSVAGGTINEYVETVKILCEQSDPSAVELNFSCPNLEKKIVCHDLPLMQDIIENVKRISQVPIIAKLSPLVTDISEVALAAQNAGADGLVLTNTYPAMTINIKTLKSKLSIMRGGMSGACIKPMSLRCVYDVYRTVKIPIVGCGGIMTGGDAIEFMLAGATIISVGSANLLSPLNSIRIVTEIENMLSKNKIKSVEEVVGIANINVNNAKKIC